MSKTRVSLDQLEKIAAAFRSRGRRLGADAVHDFRTLSEADRRFWLVDVERCLQAGGVEVLR